MAWLSERAGIWYVGWRINGEQSIRSTGSRDRLVAEFEAKKIELLEAAAKIGRLDEVMFQLRRTKEAVVLPPQSPRFAGIPAAPTPADFARWNQCELALSKVPVSLSNLELDGTPFLSVSAVYIWFAADPQGSLIENKNLIYVGETDSLYHRSTGERSYWVGFGVNHMIYLRVPAEDRKRFESLLIESVPCANRDQPPNLGKSWEILRQLIRRCTAPELPQ